MMTAKDACAAFIAMSKNHPDCKENLLKAISKSKDADKALLQIIQVKDERNFNNCFELTIIVSLVGNTVGC